MLELLSFLSAKQVLLCQALSVFMYSRGVPRCQASIKLGHIFAFNCPHYSYTSNDYVNTVFLLQRNVKDNVTKMVLPGINFRESNMIQLNDSLLVFTPDSRKENTSLTLLSNISGTVKWESLFSLGRWRVNFALALVCKKRVILTGGFRWRIMYSMSYVH